jgi:hypothetical protein
MNSMIGAISFSFLVTEFPPFFMLLLLPLPFLGCKDLCCKKLQDENTIDIK